MGNQNNSNNNHGIFDRRSTDQNYLLINEKIKNIKIAAEQQKIQDEQRFNYIFQSIKEGFEKMEERFDATDEKVDSLWDDKNKRDGSNETKKEVKKEVTDFSKFVAGGIGGLIAIVIGHFWK